MAPNVTFLKGTVRDRFFNFFLGLVLVYLSSFYVLFKYRYIMHRHIGKQIILAFLN